MSYTGMAGASFRAVRAYFPTGEPTLGTPD